MTFYIYKDISVEIDNEGYVYLKEINKILQNEGVNKKASVGNWFYSNDFIDALYKVLNIQYHSFLNKIKREKASIRVERIKNEYDYFGLIERDGKKINKIKKELFKYYVYKINTEFGDWFNNIFKKEIYVNSHIDEELIADINHEKPILKKEFHSDKKEDDIQKDIIYLLCLMDNNHKLKMECVFDDYDNPDKDRRIDFLEEENNKYIIYELKKDIINENIVSEIIKRKYIEILEKETNKEVILCFLGLKGIKEETKILMSKMPKFRFINLTDFMSKAYDNAIKNKWKRNTINLINRILKEYTYLFTEEKINEMKQQLYSNKNGYR